MSKPRTILVFFVKTHQQIHRQTLSLSVFRYLENLMTSTPPFLTDIMIKCSFQTFIHVTDLKMVTQSFKYGELTSLILVTISDATLVPGVQRPTSYPAHSCGADQPSLKSSARLSHSPSH